MLTLQLDQTALAGCVVHLDALENLRTAPLSQHRADIAAIIMLAALSIMRGAPAQAVGTTFYVNNASGSGCTDSGSGSITTPWCTFTPANAYTFGPGDQLLLARGDTWDQQLTLNGAGSATDPAVLSSYGTGALPKILRHGLGSEIAVDAENPSYFQGYSGDLVEVQSNYR